MKLIFIVLLIANLAFAVYELAIERKSTIVTPVMTSVQNFGSLQTISERESKNKKHQEESKRIALESSSVVAEEERCQMIGPYAELLHAEYLVEKLVALEVTAAIRQVEIQDGKAYWVYLKPEMSDKEALRRLYEIQAKAIDDAYIIPSGELANGISFGQFANIADAETKLSFVRGQGYAAEIKELAKSHNETWVEVHDASGQKINEEKWLELLKEEKAIERRKNYCLGVAKS